MALPTFVIETNSYEKQVVQIFDISGKIVLTQNISGTSTIDAGNLNAGIYNINISGDNGRMNKRLVIVK